MSKDRFLMRAAAYLILIRDGKILILKRFNTGWQDGKYSLIAGHLDGSETVKQTMIREAGEEAGISINEKDLAVVHVMHRQTLGNLEYIDFYLTVDKWNGEPSIKEADKCDEMRWVPVDNLPANTLPFIKQALENYSKKIFFSESDWDEVSK